MKMQHSPVYNFLMRQLDEYGKEATIRWSDIKTASAGQGQGLRIVLDGFEGDLKSRGLTVTQAYDPIVIARNDLMWRKPIDTWGDFQWRHFQFMSRCEEKAEKFLEKKLA